MKILKETKIILRKLLSPIIKFNFDNYDLYVFPGTISPADILIKYKKGNSRIRTPKHIHWVVDILLKMENDKALTLKFISMIEKIWQNSQPLQKRDFEHLQDLIKNCLKKLNVAQFEKLNSYGEYPVDFLCVLMLLLSTQEKTNRHDAYMFGQIIEELQKTDLDIFKIVSKAGFGGRK